MVTLVLSGVFLALAVSFARDEYLENEKLKKKLEEIQKNNKEIEQINEEVKEVDSSG